MSDIVERLRGIARDFPSVVLSRKRQDELDAIEESADEIEALRVENGVLRELLNIAVDEHDSNMGRSNVLAHWSYRARALTQTKDTTDDA